MRKLAFGLFVVGLLLFSFTHVFAQDDARKEVMHALVAIDAAKEDYFRKDAPYVPGLHGMSNIISGLRGWVVLHAQGQALLAEYQKRRNELRLAATALTIPEETKFLTIRQKIDLAVILTLTAYANEPLFELFRLVGETGNVQ